MESLTLVVRRRIRATPRRLFEAWTQPEQLEAWWGPKGVKCIGVEMDVREGGRYRIGNETPDGNVLWITGEFVRISAPRELVYTWNTGGDTEQVTVRFSPEGDETEVIVLHERIGSEVARNGHEGGWMGCLDGLVEFVLASERATET